MSELRAPRPQSIMITAAKAGISSVFGGSPSKKNQLQHAQQQPHQQAAPAMQPPPHRPDGRHGNGSHQGAVAHSINAENQLVLAFKVLASHDFFPKQMFPKGSREKTLPAAARDKVPLARLDARCRGGSRPANPSPCPIPHLLPAAARGQASWMAVDGDEDQVHGSYSGYIGVI